MQLLLDECFAPRVVTELRKHNLDVIGIRQRGLKGATDAQVWDEAQRLKRVVVTANVGDYRALARITSRHCGVIILRLTRESTEINAERIRQVAVQLQGADLQGRIVTVRDIELDVVPPLTK